MDEGRFEEAAREYREAAKASPEDVGLWLKLARAELFAERPWRARRAFERVSLLRPRDPEPLIEIGYTFELEREYERALEVYLRAVEIAPDTARPHRIVGTRLLRWGQPEAAIPHLTRAAALEPERAEVHQALALAAYHAGDPGAAELAYRAGLERHSSHRGLRLGLAGLLINAGRYAEALAIYDALLVAEPRFAAAHVGRGILLHELGRPDEAEAAFVRAVEIAEVKEPYQRRLEDYRRLRRQGASPRDE